MPVAILDKDRVIKLTLALYKITDRFPEDEPLRIDSRQKADNILEKFIASGQRSISEKKEAASLRESALLDIEVLLSFLLIAQKQLWAREEHLDVLSREYQGLSLFFNQNQREEVSSRQSPRKKRDDENQAKTENLAIKNKTRCSKIIDILKEKKSLQVKDLEAYFPKITKRTLRRDFDYLLKEGLVRRMGTKNMTEYVLS